MLQAAQQAGSWLRGALGKQIPVAAVILIALLLLVPQFLPMTARRLLPRSDGGAIEGLELKDFIVKVKADLASAEEEGLQKGERPLLQLQDVELVVNFVVQSRAETDVKLVTVNGSAISGLERTQKITLHLKPVPPETVVVPPEKGPIAPATGVIGPTAPPKEGPT